MTTKSTSGPWHQDGAIPRQIMTQDGQPIARVSANQIASARLIAAAPDLLEALQWALDQIDDDLDPDHQAAMQAARAAIAKATS